MPFSRALVRPPGSTFADGITSSALGPPHLGLALEQHEAYCEALETLGLAVARLAADPAFPDSTFVEDTAIVTTNGAILARPGAASRAGEVTAVGMALHDWFPDAEAIVAPGTMDGGDICEAGHHFFIGLSHRTNRAGADQLAAWLAQRGFGSTVIDIRGIPTLLHLKTGISWLGDRRLLAVDEIAGHEALRGWEIVQVPAGEDYAANCIRVNDALLVARGFPATSALLRGMGYAVVELDMSEYRKMDGGLSCLSIRW
jgi:dimethylargininase